MVDKAGDLDFYSAYSAGTVLEKNSEKSASVRMFSRALSTYPENPTSGEVYIMTRPILEAHIEELSK